jgi:hypothetical protein
LTSARCTFAGKRWWLVEEMYQRFNKDNFTVRDTTIHPKSLRSLEQSGYLTLVERGYHSKPNVYRLSDMALSKMGDLNDKNSLSIREGTGVPKPNNYCFTYCYDIVW